MIGYVCLTELKTVQKIGGRLDIFLNREALEKNKPCTEYCGFATIRLEIQEFIDPLEKFSRSII